MVENADMCTICFFFILEYGSPPINSIFWALFQDWTSFTCKAKVESLSGSCRVDCMVTIEY